MNGILEKVHEAGLTLKAGCGIGYEFSTLRPRGAYVTGAGAYTSGPAVVHGHLRQDVLHGVVRGRAPRRADGHLRRRPSRRPRLHPRQARGRAAAPVQPLPLRHRRIHGGGPRRRRVEAGVPPHAGRGRARRRRSRRPGVGGVAELAGGRRLRHQRPRKGRVPGVPLPAGPAYLGRHHVLDVRLRRTGVHPDRRDQRDEQQLVLRERPSDQPLRASSRSPPTAPASSARSTSPGSCSTRSRTARVSTGRCSARPSPCSPACSTTSWRSTGFRSTRSARRSCASGATGWATWASARPWRCCA